MRTLLTIAAALLALPAFASSDYTMEILVRGRPLQQLPSRGTTYVEAEKGAEYAVRLTNRTGGRVAVALSVDGLNVIDAKKTTARDGRKWILEPWGSITLEGWQVSQEAARRFVFTSEERSYGAWLGKTSDLGVISAAFFRERRYEPPPMPMTRQRRADAPSADAEAHAGAGAKAESRAEEDLAATGIGRKVDHRVVQVAFDEEPSPASVVTFRYEFRDALVRLGVVPRRCPEDGPLARRERARGFVDTGFAPDPY